MACLTVLIRKTAISFTACSITSLVTVDLVVFHLNRFFYLKADNMKSIRFTGRKNLIVKPIKNNFIFIISIKFIPRQRNTRGWHTGTANLLRFKYANQLQCTNKQALKR